MNRLVYLLLFPTVLSSFVSAQQSVHYYSVAGDVANPQTYRYDAGQRVSVLDVLNHAGIGEQFGDAVVIRRAPLQVVAVCPVYPKMSDRGSLLSSGDMVLFRSQSGTIPNQPNALVLIHNIPDVLPLTQTPRSLDSLLQQLRLSPPHAISVMRTSSATPATISLLGTEYIQHGDVVDLTGLAPSGISTGQMYAIAPVNGYGTGPHDGTEQRDNSVFDTDFSASQTDDAVLAGSLLSIDESAADVQMEFITAENDSAQDTNQNPFRVTSLSETDSQSAPSAPSATAADSEFNVHSVSAGSTVLNSIFIAGLVFAMGLILIGWLRTKSERDAGGLIPGIVSRPRTSGAPQATSPEQNDLREALADVDEDDPILSIGGAPAVVNDPTTGKLTDSDTRTGGESQDTPGTADAAADAIADSTATAPEVGTESLLADMSEWFGDGRPAFHSAAENRAESAEVSLDKPPVVSPAGTQKGSPTSALPRDEWRDLEDLIQNRLPIEQKQAELPLRVSLFGRPAGPQRLRIDAAHTQIPSPHMFVSDDADSRNSRQQAASGPASAARQTKSSPPQAEKRETAGTDFSRLDKALNYLEEQSDS